MEYVVCGSAFVNDIKKADGTELSGLPGGAGLFAFGGVLLYTDSAVLISGRGTDWDGWFGEWWRKNKINEDGFNDYNNITTVAKLEYYPDGRWHEYFLNGPLENERASFERAQRETLKRELCGGAKGLYVVESLDDKDFWSFFLNDVSKGSFTTMLELFTADCCAKNLDRLVNEFFPHIEIFSLNLSESFGLFSVDSEEKVIEKLLKLGKPCYYRVGKKGAYMVANGQSVFCESVNPFPERAEVDPTGCGNCSTAAALYAFTEGYDNKTIAAFASVAAGYNVMQYGPYPDFSEKTRVEARKKAETLAGTL